MKAVFRILGRLRQAAPIPRDFLPLAGLESLGLVYQSRVITDPEDFNKTLATVTDPRFPNRGANIQPYMLTPEDEASFNAAPKKPVWEAPEAGTEYKVAVDPPAQPAEPAAEDAPAPRFTLVDGEVFEGETKIASITEAGNVRMANGYGELREAVLAWHNTPTQ